MSHEGEELRKIARENRQQLIDRYTRPVVEEMERRTARCQWRLANYRNAERLRLKEEAEGAQPWEEPKLPTWEELVAEMKGHHE